VSDGRGSSHPYVVEEFTAEERNVLERFFTNLDRPVFALVNLPEAVKGALFARYSRSRKSLRRLFLDEFYRGEPIEPAAEVGTERAADLYDRVLVEFGDDSVAQLGGAHLAVEQASNVLTKLIERGRLAAYLEQSTRYVPYDDRPGGRFRYYREPNIMASRHGGTYERTLDAAFEAYASALPRLVTHLERVFPNESGDPEGVYRRTIRARACDLLRGLLPAATVSNLGVFASGQAYEAMLLRLRASPLAEARETAERIRVELDKVIPVFLRRLDQPQRGGDWVRYLVETRESFRRAGRRALAGERPERRAEVTLVDFDPEGEDKIVAAALYEATDLPEDQILRRVREMPPAERVALLRAYCGDRRNRRHRPGRALERTSYRFDILSDYGAFRDLQRHRMLTLDWQELTPRHGYEVPAELEEAGLAGSFREVLDRCAELWEKIHEELPLEAQYVVPMAFRIRYVMQMNAREAMHVLELRSSPQGHPVYRRIAQEMHRQIAEVAGHRAVAELMRYVERGEATFGRLDSERRAESRRASGTAGD